MTTKKENELTFTPKQTELLDALEAEFGPTEVKLANVNRHYNYDSYLRSGLEGVLYWYANKKVAEATNWDELERLQREERERKLAERSAEVRENMVNGIIAGILPKITRILPTSRIMYDVVDDQLGFIAYVDKKMVLAVTYDRKDFSLVVEVEGEDSKYRDDCTLLQGSTPPRQQLKGIDAVHVYLDSLELDK